MARKLLLIRHADTDAVGRKLFVGATDVDASASGLAQLGRLHDALAEYDPEVWYSSPMKRSIQTVEHILCADGASRNYKIDARLREIDFGRWEMKSFAEISATDPELVDSWTAYDSFVFPEGEAVAAFQRRVADVFSALRQLPTGQAAVVTHGGVIRTMICLALGMDAKNYLLFNVRPGTLTVLDLFQDGGVLSGLGM